MIEAPHSTDIDVYLRQPCYLAPSKLTKAPMYYWSASDRTQNAHRICNQSGTCGLCGLWNQQLADNKACGMVQLRPWPPCFKELSGIASCPPSPLSGRYFSARSGSLPGYDHGEGLNLDLPLAQSAFSPLLSAAWLKIAVSIAPAAAMRSSLMLWV